MGRDYVQLSKTVSHALRHAPWLYELELDEEGWVDIEPLLDRLRFVRDDWRDLAERDLEEMVTCSDKPRHEIQAGRIRALEGRSTAGLLRRTPAAPPETLYHGTAAQAVGNILSDGLRPVKRRYVHLSPDVLTAGEVAKRKSPRTVVLQVDARKAADAGVRFYEGNERVWLAERIPSEYIRELQPDVLGR